MEMVNIGFGLQKCGPPCFVGHILYPIAQSHCCLGSSVTIFAVALETAVKRNVMWPHFNLTLCCKPPFDELSSPIFYKQ